MTSETVGAAPAKFIPSKHWRENNTDRLHGVKWFFEEKFSKFD
jgi:hypothetical protein